jgi:hypothetical protein
MDETTSQSDTALEIPQAEDGFHEPSSEVKRRNLITGLIIVAFLTAWVLFGLRKALF